MTKPSRSKRSQPEFDPSELEDLIFTPAVGTGVGSHLLTTVDTFNTTTEVESIQTIETKHDSYLTTVPEMATVAENDSVTDQSTVVRLGELPLWMTEEGELVPASRVKRIRLAQDVLSTAEESVYDALWTAKTAVRQEVDSARIVQAGYDFLMKKTRFSKKTIQRIVDRLIDKDFIAIERPADIYQRTATVYRVFGYRLVLERQAAKQRFHVVKIGPGLLYAHPRSDLSTVATSDLSTVAKMTTVTVDKEYLTTVVVPTTIKIEQDMLGSLASSSEVRALREQIEKQLGMVDDDALSKLLTECRRRAGDCTVEEIAYFVDHKLRWVRNIQNPVGFILTAVPRHFENGGHLAVRELLRQETEARQQEWRETHAYWSRVAEDVNQPEQERAEARKVLASLVNYLKS
jgi:predicted transcriptional regulator